MMKDQEKSEIDFSERCLEQKSLYRIRTEAKRNRQIAERMAVVSSNETKQKEKALRLANRYQKEYMRLLTSRTVKWWLRVRGLLGKPYTPYKEPVSNVSMLDASSVCSVNDELLDCVHEKTGLLPDSTGCAYYSKSPLKIGIITDDFMFNYYKDAVNCIYINADNYLDIFDSGEIDFLLYVSCWRGLSCIKGGEDQPECYDYFGELGINQSVEVCSCARKMNIPVVFQSIEDPLSYKRFLPIAKQADVIFTSAEEQISSYVADTGNQNVFVLKYGVNPIIHNPIGLMEKWKTKKEFFTNGVLFAGAWYSNYKKRCSDTQRLFDGVLESLTTPLYIADRNFYSKFRSKSAFPRKYESNIIPPFEHMELQKVHKLFNWTINANSVTSSSTMCSMRSYEVQALGGLLLSNYALALSRSFPNTFFIHDKAEVAHVLNGYTDRELVNMQIEGIRNVMTAETVYDRLNEIYTKLKLPVPFKDQPVYVITEDGAIPDNLKLQSYLKYQVVSRHDAPTICQTGFAIRWNSDIYNYNYLQDLVNAFKYVDVDYVFYVNEDDWTNSFSYAQSLRSDRPVLLNLNRVAVESLFNGDVTGLSTLKGFSLLEEKWQTREVNRPYELAVITPVYNNGRYLKSRSFRSLLRSSIFEKMHIYLLDDGSTDPETLAIVQELDGVYDNVSAYYFNDGGSGSAARPRNKGVELSREPYVTFLDPDNEAVNDGYAVLLSLAKEHNVDLAFGSDTVITGDKGDCGNYCFIKDKDNILITDMKQALIESEFAAQSQQACVFKREFLEANQLTSIEGAIGEDTFFFYEVAYAAESAYCVQMPIHLYYAERDGSAVNDIGVSFFKKSFIMEKALVRFLKEKNLLEDYKRLAFDRYMRQWYMVKLQMAKFEVISECGEYISKIWELYQE